MKLTVRERFVHQYGIGTRDRTIYATAIRAIQTLGAGNSTPRFEAQDASGEWFAFTKRENPHVRLPRADALGWGPWGIIAVHGIRPVYTRTSAACIIEDRAGDEQAESLR